MTVTKILKISIIIVIQLIIIDLTSFVIIEITTAGIKNNNGTGAKKIKAKPAKCHKDHKPKALNKIINKPRKHKKDDDK